MKNLILLLTAIMTLGCSSLSNKTDSDLDKWYLKHYDYCMPGAAIVNSYVEEKDEIYKIQHLFLRYDLDKDGKKDMDVFWRIYNEKVLSNPTIIVYDKNKDGNPLIFVDYNNDGVADFMEKDNF